MNLDYSVNLVDQFVIVCANIRSCTQNLDALISVLTCRKI